MGDAANVDAFRIQAGDGFTRFSASGASDSMRFDTGGFTERMRITSSGNVGIGTSSPATKFHVQDGTSSLRFRQNGTTSETLIVGPSGGDAALYLGDNVDTVRGGLAYDTSANQLQLRGYNNSTRMAIDSTGNVGIGTTSPSRPLHISASDCRIRLTDSDAPTISVELHNSSGSGILSTNGASSLLFQTNNTERMRIDSSGNVIIANTGGTLSTATAGTSNFRAGVNAGNSIASGGNYNTVVGDEAGTAQTTGTQMTAVGYGAAAANTTADYMTAIGYRSLAANTSGEQNTGLGIQTLLANTSGSHNTALGMNVLRTNTTGASNTAVGGYAMFSNTTGGSNVAVGFQALDANTTGASNVAIGRSALSANTTASFNTTLGFNAGLAVTTGHSNTLLGYTAHDNLTTGDLNISVGYSNRPSAVGVDSEIVIGNSINGAGTNTVRIGTADGTATLELDGSDTSWAAASDERLKKNVTESTAGLSFINDLHAVTFQWESKDAITDTLPQYDAASSDPVYGTGKTHHGFIAQEVKAVIDDHSDVADGHNIWSEDPDGTQQLAPGALVPMLVKAIQELSNKNTALEARLAKLEG
jgi:hypothetical protein